MNWLLLLVVALLAWSLTRMTEGAIPLAGMPSRPLIASRLTTDELTVITRVASEEGIDARLLAAMRLTEMGGPGREFGVLDLDRFPEARTYEGQARVAARTIRRTVGRFVSAYPGLPLTDGDRLSDAFLQYLSQGGPGYDGYAPLGAANDPGGLNRFHLTNLRSNYGSVTYA